MSQKLSSPLEQKIVGPHLRHAHPHDQYLLRSEFESAGNVPATETPEAESVGVSGQVGEETRYAREDHRHQMPGVATATASGFMSAAMAVLLAAQSTPAVLSPLAGGVLDIDNGTLVWDTSDLTQVTDA